MELITHQVSRIQQLKDKSAAFWHSLTSPEKLYTLALVVLILQQGETLFSALLVTLGLTMEFWPKFSKAWDSLSGKAVILLFYAVITNFALASSASLVNEVTGVSAVYFSYTHNLAILLTLPQWILGISLACILVYQLFAPFYLILLLCAKPFGIKLVRFFSKSEHPLYSNIVRVIVCFALLIQLMSIGGDEEVTFGSLGNVVAINPQSDIDATQDSEIASETETQPEIFDLSFSSEDGEKQNFQFPIDQGYGEAVRAFIAMFAFYLEGDTHSRCRAPEGAKSIELNDYEVLHISKSSDAKYGYNFSVALCQSVAFGQQMPDS